MATAYGPSIVSNGLVLTLDAANPKSIINSVEVLVVAGGGGSGGGGNTGYQGGGGGGGGVVYYSGVLLQQINMPVTVTVGLGGIAGTQVGDNGYAGGNGGNSAFGYLIATGGGGGGGNSAVSATGGSGGGGGLYGGVGSASTQPTYAGATVYGNAGGAAQGNYNGGGGSGGGGGAGTAGGTSAEGIAGAGGQGVAFSLTGSTVYYGGGGAGRGGTTNGTAINGATAASTAGAANTGAGGGGRISTSGMAGGSGIVIVRYAGAQQATGGTITTAGGYTTHVFTSSGTFTPTAFLNLIGTGYNATINGTYVSSSGGSLTFTGDGSTAQGGNIVGAAPLLSSPNTVEFAVYTPTTSYQLLTNNYYSYGESDRVYSKNGTTNIVLGATLNAWNIFSVTFNGVNTVTGYKNGILGNTSSSFDFSGLTGDLPIGARPWSPYTQNFKLGYIRIYNRALSATEIQQNFNAIRGRYGL